MSNNDQPTSRCQIRRSKGVDWQRAASGIIVMLCVSGIALSRGGHTTLMGWHFLTVVFIAILKLIIH